jgi:phosphoribosyl 1,2-cyclic phosphodiesterase
MQKTRFLKFWGTRGSCPVSGKQYQRFGGNTCCLEIRYDDVLIVIDAGTGIRPLGNTLGTEKKIELFLSHMHLDHLTGLPFFDPLYRKDAHITIWAPLGPDRTCRALIDELLSREFFPVHLNEIQAALEFRTVYEKSPIQIGPLTLDFHHTRHPGLTYSFKITTPHQTIGYTTDNEIKIEHQQSFIDFFEGTDLFIHEAQYTEDEYTYKKGWGHSSLNHAFELVNLVKPGKWFVTHHDPEHSDSTLEELEKYAQTQKLCCPVEWVPDHFVLPLK